MLSEALKNLPEVNSVLFLGTTGDEDVINVVEGEIQVLEDSIHESLEHLGRILQAKRHA